MAVAAAAVSRDFDLGDVTAGGGVLHDARLRYRILGDTDAARENGWIVVFHALTGNAEVDAWWGPIVGPGLPLDTSRHAILTANLLGSCYGSTGPAEAAARGDTPFPVLTPADLARAHEPLLMSLGVQRVALATGGSLGGMVALEWARATGIPADRVVVFAAPAVTSPQSIAWNAAQRMAIEADPAWRGGLYHPQPGPAAGLAAARAIAMITYRSSIEFESRFGRARTRRPDTFDVDSYLRRQGEKLVARFDAASYVALTHTMDLQDVGDHAAAARATASRVGEIIGVGIDTDILYPAQEVRGWVEAYRPHTNARYAEITSRFGHDAFLIEFDQVSAILRP